MSLTPKPKSQQPEHSGQEKKAIQAGQQGYLEPEICSVVHEDHQSSKPHVIATPRATHQPDGCQVMNDVSLKILGGTAESEGNVDEAQPWGL